MLYCLSVIYFLIVFVNFFVFKFKENMFFRIGSVVKCGFGGMFLNLYIIIK